MAKRRLVAHSSEVNQRTSRCETGQESPASLHRTSGSSIIEVILTRLGNRKKQCKVRSQHLVIYDTTDVFGLAAMLLQLLSN